MTIFQGLAAIEAQRKEQQAMEKSSRRLRPAS